MLGLKNSGEIHAGIEKASQALKNELDFNVRDILDIPTDKFIDTIKRQKDLTNENIEQIAEILLSNIETNSENGMNEISRLNLLQKCLTIFDYVQANDNTYSFERNMKIKKIQSLISK